MSTKILIKSMSAIFTLSVFTLILPGCSSTGNKISMGSRIPDSILKILYGGCGWFDNPYCINGGANCPPQTACGDPVANCCICNARRGTVCQDGSSYWWPDLDGCNNETPDCPGGCIQGYCNEGICVPLPGDGDFPECGGIYNLCDD